MRYYWYWYEDRLWSGSSGIAYRKHEMDLPSIINGSPNRIFRSQKLSCMHTQLIAQLTPHTYACHLACTKLATDRLCRVLAPPEKSSLCQAYTSSMVGECILTIPADLPHTKETPVRGNTLASPTDSKDPTRTPEEEARDILAAAAKNQVENGPGTRRAAVRACKYTRTGYVEL